MTEDKRLLLEAQIAALPQRQVTLGGQIVTVKWDEENSTVYLMNSDGSWSGRKSHFTLPPEPDIVMDGQDNVLLNATDDDELSVPEALQPDAGEEKKEPDTPQDIAQQILGLGEINQAKEEEASKAGGISKKTIIIGVAGIVIVAVLAACIAMASRLISNSQSTYTEPTTPMTTASQDTQPTQETTHPTTATTPTTEPVITEATIYALKTTTAIYPGAILDADSFTQTAISDADYQILSSLYGVYTNADIEHIIGMAAQKYIPAGKYLGYNDIGKTYTPDNPWASVSTLMVEFPVSVTAKDLHKFQWGNEVRIEIEVKSQHTTPAGTEGSENNTEPTTPEGVDHNSSVVQSTVIDRYVIEQAKIVELYDKTGDKLYERYWTLALVPEIYRMDAMCNLYPTQEDASLLLPIYIEVEVKKDQQEVLNKILAGQYESLTVTVSSYVAHCENENQRNSYEDVQEVMVAVADYLQAQDTEVSP